MRARLRKKLARRATLAKLRAAADYALAERRENGAAPFSSLRERQDWMWSIIYLADLHHYQQKGCSIFAGICWVKTERGPRPAWARKERR